MSESKCYMCEVRRITHHEQLLCDICARPFPECAPVNRRAARVLGKLTAGIVYVDSRKIDNTDGIYMPVHVDRIGEDLYAIAHYGEQNGDLMADPDVVFWRRFDGWYPVEITQNYVGRYNKVLWIEKGEVVKWKRRSYRDLKVFCGQWMENIRRQQGL